MYYNFVRTHQTLKLTPAMAAGVTDRLWEIDDLVEAFEAARKLARLGRRMTQMPLSLPKRIIIVVLLSVRHT